MHIKKFENHRDDFNLIEAWEVDSNNEITGYSVWVDPEQLEYLKMKKLISVDLAEDKYGTFPIYSEKDSDEIEKYMELISQSKKYNL